MNNTEIQDPRTVGVDGLTGLKAGTDYLNPLKPYMLDFSDPSVRTQYASVQ
jgi:hypothetical protein